jgi:hypothetical protein
LREVGLSQESLDLIAERAARQDLRNPDPISDGDLRMIFQ